MKLFCQAFQQRRDWLTKLEGSDSSCRLLFSENDSIPGLILDRMGGVFVAQILTAPMEHFWSAIRPILWRALQECFGAAAPWVEDRRAHSRLKEGLTCEDTLDGGWQQAPDQFQWNGLLWQLDLKSPQKTGFYLDQRDNHTHLAKLAFQSGLRSAWDVCCFQGGFGLHLLKAGIPTHFVDSSKAALAVLEQNLKLNADALNAPHQATHADAFEWMRSRFDQKERSDCIVLDPPSFSKNSQHREAALKGLKELNLRALHCLNSGGLLCSCVCSQAISGADLDEVVREAAHDSRRSVKVIERRGPSRDHAPRLDFPEGDYLKTHIYQIEGAPRA